MKTQNDGAGVIFVGGSNPAALAVHVTTPKHQTIPRKQIISTMLMEIKPKLPKHPTPSATVANTTMRRQALSTSAQGIMTRR